MESAAPEKQQEEQSNFLYYCLSGAFVIQVVTLIAWPIALHFNDQYVKKFSITPGQQKIYDEVTWLWILPLSGLLMSLGFWENFTTGDSNVKFLKTLVKIKELSVVNKYAVYLYVSLWKCFLYFVMLLLIQAFAAFHHEQNLHSSWEIVQQLFNGFVNAFTSHEIDLIRDNTRGDSMYTSGLIKKRYFANHSFSDVLHTEVNGWPPVIVGLIQIGASLLCYNTVLFVCKICIQPFSFALPINLILPVSVSVMNFFVNTYSRDVCFFSSIYQPFEYIFWNVSIICVPFC